MPTELSSSEKTRRPPLSTTSNKPGGAPPQEQEHLPCPRCDSTNTKFCYYNNYNFSQPRHFCKSCRRYWTHGGTLRDIPVGGGTRKNAKRSRTSAASFAGPIIDNNIDNLPLPATPVLVPLTARDGGAGVGGHGGVPVTAGLDNTWQFGSAGENSFVGGDCFSWPELAISTPANGFK
ncbi:hypothetical protein POTOM_019326 [Populus tomentosa]|uniref:Dof zinc finger protein n=1 Tax=Populus tomentosa TaxID=118781 RepID=A0A8X7ZWX3_POPTO|nr:hypothetical protein POTOM_019326 [Populus tomentosa]